MHQHDEDWEVILENGSPPHCSICGANLTCRCLQNAPGDDPEGCYCECYGAPTCIHAEDASPLDLSKIRSGSFNTGTVDFHSNDGNVRLTAHWDGETLTIPVSNHYATLRVGDGYLAHITTSPQRKDAS